MSLPPSQQGKGIKKGKKVKTIEQTTCSLLVVMGVRSLVRSRSKRFTALSSRGLPWPAPITSIIYLLFVVKKIISVTVSFYRFIAKDVMIPH